MGHNLATMADGRAAMIYRGDMPWHKLGKRIVGRMLAEEAIRAAGADWTVSLQDVYRLTGDGLKAVQGRRVIVRDDTGAEFGVVSDRYRPNPVGPAS